MTKYNVVRDRQTFEYGDTELVEKSIQVAYKETSKQLLRLLLDKYELMDHLHAIKRYLLLGQGDFVQHLMDNLWYIITYAS
jgi:gamma-tubulin complex component 3